MKIWTVVTLGSVSRNSNRYIYRQLSLKRCDRNSNRRSLWEVTTGDTRVDLCMRIGALHVTKVR